MRLEKRTLTIVLTSALAFGLAVSGKAEQFPFREPGPYRNAFVETATKACLRDALTYLNADKAARFCDCKVAFVATFVTSKDYDEFTQGGGVSQHYQELADKGEAYCLSLEKDAPVSRAVELAGHICCRPILGGLHHQYVRI
jgi:hypothetical protein